jgi:hypothetical protein
MPNVKGHSPGYHDGARGIDADVGSNKKTVVFVLWLIIQRNTVHRVSFDLRSSE